MSSPNTPERNTPQTSVVKVHKCPICHKLTDNAKYRPFCSKRCADIDLGSWFTESYVIEGKAPIDEEENE
ncbi:MAG: DNA gyrase inhibitor YacG [Alphaproteobacteria bacterium]|nr:DNA gyrase inhibitor YacG [Alphaproteobacteria bacterium]